MLCQPGDTVRFLSFFQDSTTGLGVTGLTVAVNVNRGTTNAVSAGSATALDATNQPGVYYYDYAVPAAYYGTLLAYFSTATSVSQRGLVSLYISVSWLANIDTTISSRLATSGYTAPDNSSITTLTSRLTSTRAGYLDNLTNLDAAVSSRLGTGAQVTYAGGVNVVSGDTTVYIGETRGTALGNALTYTVTTPADYTGGSAIWKAQSLAKTVAVTGDAGTVTATIALTAAETVTLVEGESPMQLHIQKTGLTTVVVDAIFTAKRML